MQKIKYYYHNQPLSVYCRTNNYNYNAILNRIKYLEKKDNLSIDDIIDISINKYLAKENINKINNIFNNLSNIKTLEEFKTALNTLNLDQDTNLITTYPYPQVISILWYFGSRDITSITLDINTELYDLIGIYKSNISDTRELILLKMKRYINKVIYTLCSEYHIIVNKNNYNDFKNEIELYFMIFLNKTNLNEYPRIIKYMDMTVKGYFRCFLKKYKENINISLDEEYKDNNKSKIDDVKDNTNDYNNIDIVNLLEQILSREQINILILKYQKGYSLEEIADIMKTSIDKINDIYEEILKIIKENKDILS